jgi:hypothetical protein
MPVLANERLVTLIRDKKRIDDLLPDAICLHLSVIWAAHPTFVEMNRQFLSCGAPSDSIKQEY